VAPSLGLVAQAGVVLYMFLVGLDLNPESLRERARIAAVVSLSSIVVPFTLGAAVAAYLYPRFAGSGAPLLSFALFLGLAMSVTAFPVLARILSDRGLARTKLGAMALACAAVDDVSAWCLLAFVSGVAGANGRSAPLAAALTLGFVLVIFAVARPLMAAVMGRNRSSPSARIIAALAGLLASAWATEAIGIHAIFGAFLFGAILPREEALPPAVRQGIERGVTAVLLPAFFAFTGMHTEIGLLSGGREWLLCGLIIAVATAGKFGGTIFAGRAMKLPWREAGALGALMNTRGLMELIVLNTGLELGVISPALFTMLVLMALATTLATTPILQRLLPS
jgi:Kef-type K+ transport system membrane component KefB